MYGLPEYDYFLQQALLVQVGLTGQEVVILQGDIVTVKQRGKGHTIRDAPQFSVKIGLTDRFAGFRGA